jgi:hypothetical protein
MRLFKLLIFTQGIYILLTAIWPLIDIGSFMLVTGPKHDIWLVKTVGALLIPVGICLLSFAYFQINKIPAIILGALTALSFMIIDFYYAATDVISDVYMIDGFIELIFFLGWLFVIKSSQKKPNRSVAKQRKRKLPFS